MARGKNAGIWRISNIMDKWLDRLVVVVVARLRARKLGDERFRGVLMHAFWSRVQSRCIGAATVEGGGRKRRWKRRRRRWVIDFLDVTQHTPCVETLRPSGSAW